MTLKQTAVVAIMLVGLTVLGGITVSNKNTTTEKLETTTTIMAATPPVTATKILPIATPYVVSRVDAGAGQVIVFNAEVSEQSVAITLEHLERARKAGVKRVYLVIDSPGGSVFAGAKLTSYIKNSGLTVDTVCAGLCASMAAHIHQVGNRRLMMDKTVLMFHPASGGAQGKIEQMLSILNMIKLYVDRFDADIAARSGIPYAEFKARLSQDYWVEARDALSAGLCDGLILLTYDSLSPAITDIGEELRKKGIETKRPRLEKDSIYEFTL